jgi:thioredoxin 1
MAANLALSGAEFEEQVLKSDVPVLVDFWATWCGPCLQIAPHVEAIADEMSGQAKVFKVDVDSNRDISSQYGIMSIPALLVFKDGQEVDRHVGSTSKEHLTSFLKKHL